MSTPIQIDKHQPERRRRPVTTAYCGGCCCCCCCCCLHTIGSIVGAAVAPTMGQGNSATLSYYFDDESGEMVRDIRRPTGVSSVSVFWWMTCLLIFLGMVIPILTNPSEIGGIVIAGVIILIAMPVIQFASAILTIVLFAVWNRPDKAHQLRQVGRILGGIVLGTVLGIGAMVVIAAFFGAIH